MCSSAEEGTDATLALNQGKPPLDDLSQLQSPEAAYNIANHIFCFVIYLIGKLF